MPAQWCGGHKAPGMVDVANRRCEADNCHKVRTAPKGPLHFLWHLL